MVYEEGIRPGHWLRSVHRVSFNASALIDRRDIWPIKMHSTHLQWFCSETDERRNRDGTGLRNLSGNKLLIQWL